MSDYYESKNNSTYFLSGSLIYFTEGSGSVDKSNGTEMTLDWFINQNDITINELVEISYQTSGSRTYAADRGWV